MQHWDDGLRNITNSFFVCSPNLNNMPFKLGEQTKKLFVLMLFHLPDKINIVVF